MKRLPVNGTAIFNDIRFWVFVFFVLRMAGIMQPPLEVAHNWRQTTVAMVARNFYENEANIMLPRVDMAGEKSGITGMEFPLFNYLIYLVSLVFGYDHWYGRLINLIVSSLGSWSFYRLSRRFFGHQTAFAATILLMSSLWFAYGRKIMPDTFSVSLVMIGLDMALRWYYDGQGRQWLITGALLISFGLLSKLPAGLVMALVPVILFDHGQSLKRRTGLAIVMFLAVLPAAWWYGLHVPWLNEKGDFVHFFMGKPLAEGAAELLVRLPATAAMFYETAMKFSGFVFFAAGLFVVFRRGSLPVKAWLTLSSLLFLLFMFRAGENFSRHSYYMIPFIPVMALTAAIFLTKLPGRRTIFVLLAVAMLEGLLNQQHDFRISDNNKAILRLGHVMDQLGPKDELVAVNSGEYPTPLYFAHRKGWLLSNEQLADTLLMKELRDKGMKKVIVLKKAFGKPTGLKADIRWDDDDFRVYAY